MPYGLVMTGTVAPSGTLLRSPVFDTGFIGGIAALALGSAFLVVVRPELFGLVLFLDVWLLGYHHVFSTFTRFLGDRATAGEHLALLTWWPLGIAATVAAVGLSAGAWVLTTVYLYWQWFHYTRQSWGIARAYERSSGEPLPESPLLFTATFYSVPLWGILHRSHQDPEQFLMVDVWTVPIPGLLVAAAAVAAMALVLSTAVARYRAWRRGQLPVAHTLMVLSHLAVFAVGYLVIDNIDFGWLAINIWHNAQYVAFVWLANNRQANRSNRPGIMKRLSSDGRMAQYLLASVTASTAAYIAVGLTLATVVTPVIVYQAINFHHYVVDGRIWKSRTQRRRTLEKLR